MGHDRLRAMAGQAGTEVRFCPVDLLAVFGETGGLPLGKRPPARRAYRMQELKRWRTRLGQGAQRDPDLSPGWTESS